MPHLVYSDVKNKVLKRERYKVKITQSKTIFPVFTDDKEQFSKIKGQKRFLRLVKFHVSLPICTQLKHPQAPTTNAMLPKTINFVKLRMTTIARTLQAFSMIPPYHFLRVPNQFETDVTTIGKGSAPTGDIGSFEVELFTWPKAANFSPFDPMLQDTEWYDQGANYGIPLVKNFSAVIGSALTATLPDEKPSNFASVRDTKEVGSEAKIPCVTYEFLGTIQSQLINKKVCVRPQRNSTTAAIYTQNYVLGSFSSTKEDSQILSEIGYDTDAVYIDLWENLHTYDPSYNLDTSYKMQNSVSITTPADFEFAGQADIDKLLNVEKYFPFDESTGALDTNASASIPTRINENLSTGAGLRQYLTKLNVHVEFEIILVDMTLK